MSAGALALLRHIRRLASQVPPAPDGDAVLLGRFVRHRDEDAFTTLVRRHGPMVRRVCRRVLADSHAAEDAFQATFCVLARKAAAVRPPEALASWLHGVAYRVALKARAAAAHRQARETAAPDLDPPDPHPDPLAELSARELLGVVDEEIQRLPGAYRLPVVLCCLEGRTREEAARLLGWTEGAVKGRLERGRARLHARLTRRGLTLAGALAAVEVARAATSAGLPAEATARTALAFATGRAAVSAAVARLALEGLGGPAVSPVKALALLLLGMGMAAAVAGTLAHSGRAVVSAVAAPDLADQDGDGSPPPAEDRPKGTDCYGDPLPAGAIARMGTVRWRTDGGSADALAVAPDGKTLVSVSVTKGITVWDTITGKIVRQFPKEGESRPKWLGPNSLSVSVVSADGRKAAFLPENGPIYLMDIATGKILQTWTNPRGSARRAALSADGKVLATWAGRAVQVWDAAAGKLLRAWPVAQKQEIGGVTPRWLALSGDGKTLAWVGAERDCTIRLIDVTTGAERQRLGQHDGGDRQIYLSFDGERLVAMSSRGLVQLWDVKRGRVLHKWSGRPNSMMPMAAFTPDGTKLLLTRGEDAMRLLDVATGNELWRVPRPLSSSVQDAYAFSPDGKTLFLTEGGSEVIDRHDAATGRLILAPGDQAGYFKEAALSADERTLYTLGEDHLLRAWDSGTGKEERATDTGAAWGKLSPDGRLLAVRKKDEIIRLYDTTTGLEVRQLGPLPGHDPYSACFSPDGRLLAVCGNDVGGKQGNLIVLWDMAAGKELRQVSVRAGVWQIAFTEDGKSLVWYYLTSDPKEESVLHSLEVATGRERPELPLPPIGSWTGNLSPDGKTIVLEDARYNPSLACYEVATGKLRMEIKPLYTLPPHIAFSPDRRLLLVADGQGGVQVHDAFDGRQFFRLTGHRGGVFSFVFSRSGRLLVTTSGDGTALVWDATEVFRKARREPDKLSAAELSSLWDDLAGADAVKAYQAIGRLAASPGETLPWLRERPRPVPTAPIDARRLDQLLSQLGNDDYQIRERATREIEKYGERAQPALDRLLSGKPSVEVRARAKGLVDKCAPAGSPARLRSLRAVEVLEHVGTPEARRLLESLAHGAPEARLTQEAKASLERLISAP